MVGQCGGRVGWQLGWCVWWGWKVHAGNNAPPIEQAEQPSRPLKVLCETRMQCCPLGPTGQSSGWGVWEGELARRGKEGDVDLKHALRIERS